MRVATPSPIYSDELEPALRMYKSARGKSFRSAVAAADHERCSFLYGHPVKRCRFVAALGQERCKTHMTVDTASHARVACPLDPTHSVESWQLGRHLTMCPSLRDSRFVELQPFFKRGVNTRVCTVPLARHSCSGRTPISPGRIEAAYVEAVQRVVGGNREDAELLLQNSVLGEDVIHQGHAEKHSEQNNALAGLIRQDGLACPGAVVIEYGCGRGGLAREVLNRNPGVRGLLIDRDTRRHKVDHLFESCEAVLRLRLDIADFDLQSLLAVQSAPTIDQGSVFNCAKTASRLDDLWKKALHLQSKQWPPPRVLMCAKHLCGGATDLALRSLSVSQHQSTAISICCATCCHHRCDSDSYVNVDFFTSLGLCSSLSDFEEVVSFAGWGVGGVDLEKRRVGLMAKRLLDLGRVAWLRDKLGIRDAHLTHYVSKDVTPENVAIVAGGHRSAAY